MLEQENKAASASTSPIPYKKPQAALETPAPSPPSSEETLVPDAQNLREPLEVPPLPDEAEVPSEASAPLRDPAAVRRGLKAKDYVNRVARFLELEELIDYETTPTRECDLNALKTVVAALLSMAKSQNPDMLSEILGHLDRERLLKGQSDSEEIEEEPLPTEALEDPECLPEESPNFESRVAFDEDLSPDEVLAPYSPDEGYTEETPSSTHVNLDLMADAPVDEDEDTLAYSLSPPTTVPLEELPAVDDLEEDPPLPPLEPELAVAVPVHHQRNHRLPLAVGPPLLLGCLPEGESSTVFLNEVPPPAVWNYRSIYKHEELEVPVQEDYEDFPSNEHSLPLGLNLLPLPAKEKPTQVPRWKLNEPAHQSFLPNPLDYYANNPAALQHGQYMVPGGAHSASHQNSNHPTHESLSNHNSISQNGSYSSLTSHPPNHFVNSQLNDSFDHGYAPRSDQPHYMITTSRLSESHGAQSGPSPSPNRNEVHHSQPIPAHQYYSSRSDVRPASSPYYDQPRHELRPLSLNNYTTQTINRFPKPTNHYQPQAPSQPEPYKFSNPVDSRSYVSSARAPFRQPGNILNSSGSKLFSGRYPN